MPTNPIHPRLLAVAVMLPFAPGQEQDPGPLGDLLLGEGDAGPDCQAEWRQDQGRAEGSVDSHGIGLREGSQVG